MKPPPFVYHRPTTPEEALEILAEVGMVFQTFNLCPHLTVVENSTLAPVRVRTTPKGQAEARARQRLDDVGLSHRAEAYPRRLSGGEQQRVSLARALVTEPAILLADEPTGDLDARTSGVVFDLIERLHGAHRLTSVIVTHNMTLARRCSRILRLDSGRLTQISPTTEN